MLIFDLNFTYSDIRGDYSSYKEFYKKDGVVTFLDKNLKGARYFNYTENPNRAPLPAAKNMIYDLRTANAYSPLISKDYYDFFYKFGGINDSSGYQEIDDSYLEKQMKLMSMMYVKYLVTDRTLEMKSLEKVYEEAHWRVYENKLVGDRAWVVEKYEVIEDRPKLLSQMRESAFDPYKKVFLERAPYAFFGEQKKASRSNKVDWIQDNEEGRGVMVSCKKDCILILSEMYYPGWIAEVDGVYQEVFRVNYLLLGIPLSKGDHIVRFYFSPYI